MDTVIRVGDITTIEADAIVVNLFEGIKKPGGATAAVDRELDGAIAKLIKHGEIKGKLNEITIIHSMGKLPARIIAVAGLGKQGELTVEKVRGLTGEVCRTLRKLNCRRIATIIHGAGSGRIKPEESTQAIAEGSLLGLYRFRKHMSKESEISDVDELFIVEREGARISSLKKACTRGRILAEATNLARDLVNEPANLMTPSELANIATKIAKSFKLTHMILDREQMDKEGMGALLGVARGSCQPPKLILLSYKGNSDSKEILGLVGKGITFDSGGISIKPSESMWEMKGDMSGAAAVLAAMSAIAQLKPKLNITCVVPAAENLPSGDATKPGDILKASNGKTIEVVNTDAEGRLILADALAYAVKQGVSPIVDIATLTGACHIALGNLRSGLFSRNQKLIDKLMAAGNNSGELLWQMPMDEEYKELNKSEVADIKNSGGRWGGAITAAQFLSEFIGTTPWAHIDIAGTFLSDKERGYLVKGATGIGVRLLVNLVLSYEKN